MIAVEIINEGLVHYVSGWNPQPLFGTITLPVYQKLLSPAPAPYSQQLLNFVDRTTVHHFRRRRWFECWNEGAVFHGLDLADVEGGVDAQGSGQAKAYSSRTDDL